MSEISLPTEEEIIEELKRQAANYDLASEDLVIELYQLEKKYSTMERRRGITTDIRGTIEEEVDLDDI
jgi:hypothetical protein